MSPRIPTPSDFAHLSPTLPHTLHFPSPPESTTAIMILLHGLGDSHVPFASFARGVNLPGVLAISVRGTASLPGAGVMFGSGGGGETNGFWHWGDDVIVEEGGLDNDPGFERARRVLMEELIGGVLVGKCGWEYSDVIVFGFGQGGSLALGLASWVRSKGEKFKGVVSIGGALPGSMVPSGREKSVSRVLVCQLIGDEVERVKREFENVQVVQWKRREVGMPRNREEMFPIMKFFADCLNSGW